MEKEIIIKPTFDIKSSFKATLQVLLGSKLILLIILILMVIFNNIFVNFNNIEISLIETITSILVIPLFLSFFIFSIFRKTKKSILENPRLKENIIYIINNKSFQEKGDSFDLKYFWENIKKIVEEKDFFLIYVAKNNAIVIKKTDLKDNQYIELKELFNSLNIKKKLI
jgi:amino acid permease